MALTRPKYSQIYDTDWKQSVRLATTADVGNLFLANLQPNTVDSVSVSVNDRILVKDQTRPFENGIYIVRSVGTGSNGWWTRTLDAAQSSFVTSGLSAVVSEGAVNAGREFRLTTPDPITLDTTNLSFTLIAAQPAGANTQIQFNDMNIMSGSPGFTFLKNGNTVNITGNVIASVGSFGNIVSGNITTSGAGQFSGFFNENITSSGVFVGNAGSGTPSPRIGFFNGNTAQNWQVDNFFGDFRWFVPGAVKLNLNPTGNLTVYGSILPAANITYDLGSPTQRFRSAYFSGNTVYIGDQSISVDSAGTWTFTSHGANISMGATTPLDPPSANIAGNLIVGGILLANNSPGQNGYVLRSTGAGITWAAPSAGSGIDNGTSNVSILGSGADVVTTIGGNIVTRTSAKEFAITGNLTVSGNLFVNGNVTTINANNLSINDSLIYLADDNPADTIDIGFVSSFTPGGGSYQHTGFVRDASDGVWKLFAGVASEPTTTVDFTNATYSTIRVGNIYAGGTTANDNRFLQSTAGGLAWTAATSISSGVTSATADATSVLVVANGVNSARFYGDVAYVYPDLELSANLLVGGVADITGNLSAAYFIGDGSQLTGLPAGYSNVQVATYFASGTATGNIIVGNILPTANNVSNIGSASSRFRIIHAQATQAQYADLAENYTSDQQYPAGTVVVFGGEEEVTISTVSHDPAVAGVVSTNPAYHMNTDTEGVAVALTGRVPTKVKGPITKGDRVVTSDIQGTGERLDMTKYQPGCIIGKALEDIPDDSVQLIEVVVGRV